MSPKYYKLRVVRLEGLQWNSGLHRKIPNLYVEVKLDNVVQTTSTVKKSASPVWDETFVFSSSNASASMEMQVRHRSRWSSDPCVGFLEIKLDDLLTKCNNREVRVDLRPSLEDASPNAAGVITLHLEESDSMVSVGAIIDTAVEDVRLGGIERSGRALDVMESIEDRTTPVNGHGDLYRAVGELFSRLGLFKEVMDSLSEVHPFLTIVWKVTSALYTAVEHVFQVDKRIVELVRAMIDVFAFVQDVEALPNKVATVQQPIDGLLKQTYACCLFVRKYTSKGFLGRALQTQATKKIDEFEQALAQFKQRIDSGVNLFTAVVSLRVSQGIDEILLRQRLNPNVNDGSGRPVCLPNTRVDILSDIIGWIFSETSENVLWLYGVAGSGKSTISTTIADHLREMSRLGAFLFFERGKSESSSVIRSIAYKLALFDPSIGSSMLSGIENDKDITSASLTVQFNTLLLQPLRVVAESMYGPVAIVLDALDECGTAETRSDLMKLFKNEFPKLPSVFRFIFTSRRERDIDKALSHPENVLAMELDYASVASQNDVLSFLLTEMPAAVCEQVEIPADWSWDEKMTDLGKAAGGLFIWASTAVKMVRNSDSPFYQLDCIVSNSRLLTNSTASGMDDLYATVLRNSGIEWEKERSRERFRKVLTPLLLSKAPLSSKTMDGILGFPPHDPSLLVLSKLRSVVAYTPGGPVSLFHASFSDYLLSPKRTNDPWFIDIRVAKRFIAERCFTVMEDLLRFNVCDLRTSFIRNDDVPGLADRIKERVPSHLVYACLYWMQHLHDAPCTSDLLDKLSDFARRRLLYWFEVLSLHKAFVRIASYVLTDSATWAEPHDAAIASFLRDASTLAITFAPAIMHSIPHIYVSMLPLAKSDSQVAVHYLERTLHMVQVERKGVKRPTMYLKVFEGHSDRILSVAFSPNGKRVASAAEDNTIRIWDVDSGEALMLLTGHSDVVMSVSYSPNGKCIVSGSSDGSLRVWDAENGDLVLAPMVGHNKAVRCVAFSSDGKRIASGSSDRTIIVWNAADGQRTSGPFTGHTGRVNSIAFSPDDTQLVSGSNDKTIIIWNVETGKPIFDPLGGHSHWVNSVAFSPDGEHIVSGSSDMTVKVWEVESGKDVSTLRGHTNSITSVAYSTCGTRIASGSSDTTIIVWDAEDGQVASGPFKGHSSYVCSVAWSPDGKYIISGSDDKTVRIWDAAVRTDVSETFSGHKGNVYAIALSPDGRLIASASQDMSLIVWDVESGDAITGPLLGHRGWVSCVAFSHDGSRLVSGSFDTTIRVWNAETGAMVFDPLEGHTNAVSCVALSPDGSKLVSGSYDKTIKVWDFATGVLIACPLHSDSVSVRSVVFSPDGKWLAFSCLDKMIRVWNAETWERALEPLAGHTGEVYSVSFSPDGTRIGSGSEDGAIMVWDAKIGRVIAGPLKTHTKTVWSVIFSRDARHVLSASEDTTIRVWNLETGSCICEPLKGHTGAVSSLALSASGSRLFSGSVDKTIRVWDVSDLLRSAGDGTGDRAITSPGGEEGLLDWTLGDNGWIVGGGDGHELLLWVPPDLRPTLWRPRNTGIFGCEFSMRLDFTGAALGERWRECFTPFSED